MQELLLSFKYKYYSPLYYGFKKYELLGQDKTLKLRPYHLIEILSY